MIVFICKAVELVTFQYTLDGVSNKIPLLGGIVSDLVRNSDN